MTLSKIAMVKVFVLFDWPSYFLGFFLKTYQLKITTFCNSSMSSSPFSQQDSIHIHICLHEGTIVIKYIAIQIFPPEFNTIFVYY